MSSKGEDLGKECALTSLPTELVMEVIGRVATSSLDDFYSAKLCCKTFYEVGDEDYIHRFISLEKLPVVQWNHNQQISMFLDKCRKSNNPEALFRKGVIDYFGGKDIDKALESLEVASKLGHAEASYVIAIMSLFGGDESKQKGIKLLSGMKNSKIKKRRVRHSRQRLKSIIKSIWVRNPLILSHRPTCCTMHGQHRRRTGWVIDDINENDDNGCDGCACDEEIAPICDALPQLIL